MYNIQYLTSHKDVVSTSDMIESVQDETASFPGRVGMRLKMAVSLDPVLTLFTRHSHTCQRNELRRTHADPVSNARPLYRELLSTRLRCNEGAVAKLAVWCCTYRCLFVYYNYVGIILCVLVCYTILVFVCYMIHVFVCACASLAPILPPVLTWSNVLMEGDSPPCTQKIYRKEVERPMTQPLAGHWCFKQDVLLQTHCWPYTAPTIPLIMRLTSTRMLCYTHTFLAIHGSYLSINNG